MRLLSGGLGKNWDVGYVEVGRALLLGCMVHGLRHSGCIATHRREGEIMQRKVLRYLARKYDFDLVPRGSIAEPASAVPRSVAGAEQFRFVHDLISHPMDGRLASAYATIPSISERLYFRSSICTAQDFRNTEFDRWRALLGEDARMHRKIWEHVFICAHLEAAGVLREGMRGLGFGVGKEPLPAAFANLGVSVVATDMAPDAATAAGWISTDQHSSAIEHLNEKELCPPDKFGKLVRFQTCDMNNISGDFSGFDFCWSSCSFEHLGSIRAGLDFVRNSIATLKPGGIAVHTTEYNVSSNELTIDNNPTLVLFRRKDIQLLVEELKSDGHHVADICFDVLSEPVDLFVDLPPYKADTHIRLALGPFVSSSIGLVIQRGA